MILVSPAHADQQITLPADILAGLIDAIGTDDYANVCLQLFAESLDVEHWALFRYRSDKPVSCVATASHVHAAAASDNIDRFIARCHKVDPSLPAVRRFDRGAPCVVRIEIEDIQDRQYRHCFEQARVHERLSFFSSAGSELHQLSIYRGPRKRSFSPQELARFSIIARLVLATAFKQEGLCSNNMPTPLYPDLQAIEQRLDSLSTSLSRREREVCARAASGKTIEATALDLKIAKTSVITYRQRAYQKLGICSQIELVALVNNLSDRNVAGRA